MEFEDTLRDALRADAVELVPVGPGPEDARRRAFRRKRRMQSGVIVASAVVLVGGTLAFIGTRSSGNDPEPKIATQPSAPLPDLAWRAVDGTVLYAATHFTTADGVTYALSTAPGSKPSTTGVEPQELYASRDGVAWTHVSLGAAPWVADLAEGDGVLYAVGTGPGTQANPVSYKLSTSSDGGAKWNDTAVPVSFTALKSTTPATLSTSAHVARGPHTTVVMAKATYQLNFGNTLGEETGFRLTATGIDVVDYAACKRASVPASGKSGCGENVIDKRSWAQIGVANPEALNQQVALVREDGHDWQTIKLPVGADTSVSDVTATSHGFVMAEQNWGRNSTGRASTLLFSSPDGRTWTPLAGVPAMDWVSISGDRIIGSNSESATLYASNDAGGTWVETANVAGLVPGNDPVTDAGSGLEAGPLGFGVLVHTGTPVTPNTVKDGTPVTAVPNASSEHTFLLHSTDGAKWGVTDLSKVGAPSTGWASSVSVGADHIEVSYEVPQKAGDGGDQTYKLVTLIATPKA